MRWDCVFEEARCEVLCENRSKNGSGEQQHENHIKQSVIDQALTGGVSSMPRSGHFSREFSGNRGLNCRI